MSFPFDKAIEVASRLTDEIPAAAFALVILLAALVFALYKRGRLSKEHTKVSLVVVSAIATIGVLLLITKAYRSTHSVYRIRVTVLGVDKNPAEDVMVICSTGGEVKTVGGGSECDVPPANIPVEGIVTVYATKDHPSCPAKAK